MNSASSVVPLSHRDTRDTAEHCKIELDSTAAERIQALPPRVKVLGVFKTKRVFINSVNVPASQEGLSTPPSHAPSAPEDDGVEAPCWGTRERSPGIRYPPGAKVLGETLRTFAQTLQETSAWPTSKSHRSALGDEHQSQHRPLPSKLQAGTRRMDARKERHRHNHLHGSQQGRGVGILSSVSEWLTRQQRRVRANGASFLGLPTTAEEAVPALMGEGSAYGRTSSAAQDSSFSVDSRHQRNVDSPVPTPASSPTPTSSLDAMEHVVERYRDLMERWQVWCLTGQRVDPNVQHVPSLLPGLPTSFQYFAPRETDRSGKASGFPAEEQAQQATTPLSLGFSCHVEESVLQAWVRRMVDVVAQRLDPRSLSHKDDVTPSEQRLGGLQVNKAASHSFRDSYLDNREVPSSSPLHMHSTASAVRQGGSYDPRPGGVIPNGEEVEEAYVYEEDVSDDDEKGYDSASSDGVATESDDGEQSYVVEAEEVTGSRLALASSAMSRSVMKRVSNSWTKLWDAVSGNNHRPVPGEGESVEVVGILSPRAIRARRRLRRHRQTGVTGTAALRDTRGSEEEKDGRHVHFSVDDATRPGDQHLHRAQRESLQPTAWERPVALALAGGAAAGTTRGPMRVSRQASRTSFSSTTLSAPPTQSSLPSQQTDLVARSATTSAQCVSATQGSSQASGEMGLPSSTDCGSANTSGAHEASSRLSSRAGSGADRGSGHTLAGRLAEDLSRMVQCRARHEAEAVTRAREERARHSRRYAGVTAPGHAGDPLPTTTDTGSASSASFIVAPTTAAVAEAVVGPAPSVAGLDAERLGQILCRYAYEDDEETDGGDSATSTVSDATKPSLPCSERPDGANDSIVTSHLFDHHHSLDRLHHFTKRGFGADRKAAATVVEEGGGVHKQTPDATLNASMDQAPVYVQDPERGEVLLVRRPNRNVSSTTGTVLEEKCIALRRHEAKRRNSAKDAVAARRYREPGDAVLLGERSFQQEVLLECLYDAYVNGDAALASDPAQLQANARRRNSVRRGLCSGEGADSRSQRVSEPQSLLTATTHTTRDGAVRAAYDAVSEAALFEVVESAVQAKLADIAGVAARATSEWTLRSVLASLVKSVTGGDATAGSLNARDKTRRGTGEAAFKGIRAHITTGKPASVALLAKDREDEAILDRIAQKANSQEVALDFAGVPSHFASPSRASTATLSYSPMTFTQLASLRPQAWLNDQVINNYLQLLCESVNHDHGGREVVASLGTHFYAKVESEMATLVAKAGGDAASSVNTKTGDSIEKAALPSLPAGHALLRWLRRRTHLLLPYAASPASSGKAATTTATTMVRTVLVPVNLFGQHWTLAVWHKDTDTWCFHDSLHRSPNVAHTRGEEVLRELDHVMRECQRHLCPDSVTSTSGDDSGVPSNRRRLIALPVGNARPPASTTASDRVSVSNAMVDTLAPFSSLSAVKEAQDTLRRRTPFLAKRAREAMEKDTLAIHGPRVEKRSSAGAAVPPPPSESPRYLEELTETDVAWFAPGQHTIPQQRNGDDCGVFVCQTAWCVAQGVAVSYAPAEAAILRDVITLELWHRRLLRRLPTDWMPSSMDTTMPLHDERDKQAE